MTLLFSVTRQRVCNRFWSPMCINTVKTETMCIGDTADFFVDGTELANVTRFKYLGSYVSRDCSMKEELASRIQAMSCAFGRLRKRVFDSHDLTASTKVAVYNQCLMPLLMYWSETWTLYQHEIMQLRIIQQRHLRLILNIKSDDYISNEELLRHADVEDMDVMLVRTRLRWLGHVCRINNDRPGKQLLYCELARGSRPIGRSKLRFKDTCKSSLKCGHALDQWFSTVDNRAEWKRLTRVEKGREGLDVELNRGKLWIYPYSGNRRIIIMFSWKIRAQNQAFVHPARRCKDLDCGFLKQWKAKASATGKFPSLVSNVSDYWMCIWTGQISEP